MQQLTSEQRTEDWITARLGKATASRFGDIMARGRGSAESAARRNYKAQLVAERLSGNKEESFTSSAMAWGTDFEDTARLRYELRSGNEVQECGFYLHDTLEAGASPDGLIGDDGLLEIKCPNTATHIETLKLQEVPRQYFWQVHGQMWITGRQWCDFVSFDPRMPPNAQLFITRVHRDEDIIEDLQAQVTTFLREVEAEVQFIKNYKEGN